MLKDKDKDKDKMLNLKNYDHSQIAEMRGQVRMNITRLEKLGATRTVDQDIELTDQRALMRRLTREIKERFVQERLF